MGLARFQAPHVEGLYSTRSAVCFAVLVVVVMLPTCCRQRCMRIAHAVAYVAICTRLFLIHHPIFEVPAKYEFFSLQPVPMLSLDENQVGMLRQRLMYFQNHERLVVGATAAVLVAVIMVALYVRYSRSLLLWRTGLVCLSVAWLREEPLADRVAAKPAVASALTGVHDQLTDAYVLVRCVSAQSAASPLAQSSNTREPAALVVFGTRHFPFTDRTFDALSLLCSLCSSAFSLPSQGSNHSNFSAASFTASTEAASIATAAAATIPSAAALATSTLAAAAATPFAAATLASTAIALAASVATATVTAALTTASSATTIIATVTAAIPSSSAVASSTLRTSAASFASAAVTPAALASSALASALIASSVAASALTIAAAPVDTTALAAAFSAAALATSALSLSAASLSATSLPAAAASTAAVAAAAVAAAIATLGTATRLFRVDGHQRPRPASIRAVCAGAGRELDDRPRGPRGCRP